MVADLGDRSVAVLPDHGRRLIAVVYADMAGYSRLIGLDDASTFERLREMRRDLIDPALARHSGTLVSTGGDSLLVRFDNIISAMRFAVDVQRGVPDFDGDYAPDRRIRFRMGVNVGDAIPDGSNLHGEGVNIAARLQSVCPPGAICVSRVVRDHIGNRIGLKFEQLGPLALKNIAQPVEAFVLRLDTEASTAARYARRRLRHVAFAGIAALLLAGGGGAAWWLYRDISRPIASAQSTPAFVPPDVGIAKAPRLSLVVLPFENLTGDATQDYLVDGLTEDLTTDVADLPGLLVIARNSAFTYKGKAVDIRRVGEELGVRYALEGSVRKLGAALRVNVRLVSAETGADLWADRFDVEAGAAGPGQDEIVRRIAQTMNVQLIDTESARGARERPASPDATDVLLHARSLFSLPPNPQRLIEERELLERAVQLDPSSVMALTTLAEVFLNNLTGPEDPATPETFARADALLARAEALPLQRGSAYVVATRAYLLRAEDRCTEAMAILQTAIAAFPNSNSLYFQLGQCLMYSGRAAEAVPQYEQAIRLNPRDFHIWERYRGMGQASIILGKYDEAIVWEQRYLAAWPGAPAKLLAYRYAEITAAHVFAGRSAMAHTAATEASRLWPTMTVRGFYGGSTANPVFNAQIAHIKEGMRLAGLRDHADEDADFGVVSDDSLHMTDDAHTPTAAPGARVIRTADLPAFLERNKPLVLDMNTWGKSIPGAIALWGAGIGGTTSDPFQARLGRKMQELTHGDPSMPVVTVAWNADRYSSRNLALRLVALGYTNVIWYRGGREAWEVAGLPETEVVVQEW
jgi:TolB-like protein/class 3 adenylate cyclase/Tfp pilus assembly protein PilF/rhodanese-related sulfurtransferase